MRDFPKWSRPVVLRPRFGESRISGLCLGHVSESLESQTFIGRPLKFHTDLGLLSGGG